MSGKHDKAAADEQAANLLLTGPIVIRGLGRGMKDALIPGRPSRHRAFAGDEPAQRQETDASSLAPADGDVETGGQPALDGEAPESTGAAVERGSAVEPTPLRWMFASGVSVGDPGPSSELSGAPTTQEPLLEDPPFPAADTVAQTGGADGPEEDRVDDRSADDAPPEPEDAERSRDDDQDDRSATAEDEGGRVLDEAAEQSDAAAGSQEEAPSGESESESESEPQTATDEPAVEFATPDTESSVSPPPDSSESEASEAEAEADPTSTDVIDDFVVQPIGPADVGSEGSDEPDVSLATPTEVEADASDEAPTSEVEHAMEWDEPESADTFDATDWNGEAEAPAPDDTDDSEVDRSEPETPETATGEQLDSAPSDDERVESAASDDERLQPAVEPEDLESTDAEVESPDETQDVPSDPIEQPEWRPDDAVIDADDRSEWQGDDAVVDPGDRSEWHANEAVDDADAPTPEAIDHEQPPAEDESTDAEERAHPGDGDEHPGDEHAAEAEDAEERLPAPWDQPADEPSAEVQPAAGEPVEVLGVDPIDVEHADAPADDPGPVAHDGNESARPDDDHALVVDDPDRIGPDTAGIAEGQDEAVTAPSAVATGVSIVVPPVRSVPRAVGPPVPAEARPAQPPRRVRPMRDRVGREAIGIAVLVVLALVCAGLITAVYLKTQRDAAIAAQEAANYTPPPLATPEPTATGPLVAVIGDGTTSAAASGVTTAQKWSALLGTTLDGTVDTDASSGMGYGAKGGSGETFVQAAAKVPAKADAIIFFGGAADSNISPLSLAKAATDAFSAAKTQAPDAKLIVVGPAISAGVSDADLAVIRSTLKSAANIAEAKWIDPIDASWLSTARQSASSPSALTAADEKTIASKMAAAVKKALG